MVSTTLRRIADVIDEIEREKIPCLPQWTQEAEGRLVASGATRVTVRGSMRDGLLIDPQIKSPT